MILMLTQSMKNRNSILSGGLKWLAVYGCWILLAAFYATQQTLQNVFNNNRAAGQWARFFGFEFASATIWFLLTPFILWFCRRFPVERERRFTHIILHLLFGAAAIIWKIGLDALILPFLGMTFGDQTFSYFEVFQAIGVYSIHLYLPTYIGVVVIAHAAAYYRQFRERERTALRLETELVNAQLQMLKTQLQPHFLFNTLQAISTLMHRDVKLADRVLTRLSELLRATLEQEGVPEVSLKIELEMLERYLEIEQTRFQERLTIQMKIDPATLDARVPNMILQPIVENAIRHGISARASGGKVEIGAERRNGTLLLSVSDNGKGVLLNADNRVEREGVGLTNTRARLVHLYGESSQVEMKSEPEQGLRIVLTIPFRNRE